ncbi:MAG: hypothetical protein JSR69_20090 [Proteobacteria bacterium]|nr:hypothetical protein [Pseudomonadota bacterium]
MIDTAIALALIFMMLAALVSGIGELLAMILQLRGKTLLRGIESLLSGATALNNNDLSLKDRIYAHPMIDTLRDGKRLPSYIPSASFALAFVDTLTQGYKTAAPLFAGLPEAVSKLPDGNLRQALTVLVAQANGDAAKLQTLLEGHFDKIMERVSGWYKRKSQLYVFLIALVVAGALNIDTFAISRQLVHDTELRNRLVAQAELVVKQAPPAPATAAAAAPAAPPANADLQKEVAQVKEQLKQLNELRLPIGWPRAAADADSAAAWGLTLAGWIISALAATLGAPFWFDALSKLVSLRGSGAKPESGGSAGATPATAPPSQTTVVVQNPAPAAPPEATQASGPLNDFESTRLDEIDIENIQRALGMPDTQLSGVLDANTRAMLRTWQQNNGRSPSGTLDEPTVLAILHPAN